MDIALDGDLDNGSGQVATGADNATVSARNISIAANGTIQSNGNLTLEVDERLSNQGAVVSLGSLALHAQQLSNSGSVTANGMLSLVANVDNQGAVSGQRLNIKSDQLTNSGTLHAEEELAVVAARVDNSGAMESAGNSRVDASLLNNQHGQIVAMGESTVQADDLENADGLIHGGTALEINAGTVNNQSGTLQSQNALTLSGDKVDNTNGLILSATDLNAKGVSLNNANGVIQGQQVALSYSDKIDNAKGQVIASGNLSLDTPNLNNQEGTLQGQDFSLVASDFTNNGNILASNTLSIASTGNLTNHGLLQGNAVNADAGQALTNDGQIVGNSVALSAASVSNDGGQLIASSSEGESLQIITSQPISNQSGVIQSAGQSLTLHQAINNDKGQILLLGQGLLTLNGLQNHQGTVFSAGNLAVQGALSNDSGQIQATDDVSITGPALSNVAGLIQAGQGLTVSGNTFDNSQGQLVSGGQLSLSLQDALNNTNGLIAHGSDGQLQAASLNNHGGQWLHSGTGSLVLKADSIDNSQGVLASNGQLQLTSQQLDNGAGQVQGASAQIETGQLNNQAGVLTGQSLLTVNAGDIDNRGGEVSGGALHLNGAGLLNDGGKLVGINGTDITLSGVLDNGQGQVLSGGDAHLTAGGLHNGAQGLIQLSSTGNLALDIAGQMDNAGEISSLGQLALTAQSLSNSGLVAANDAMSLVGDIENSGQLSASQLHVSGSRFYNSGQVSAGQSLLLDSDAIANQGHIESAGTGQISTAQLDNSQGEIVVLGVSDIDAGTLSNRSGLIHGGEGLNVTADIADNQGGHLQSAGAVSLSGGSLDNQGGQVLSGSQLTVQHQQVDNRGGTLQGQDVSLSVSGQLDNGAGQILADQGLSISAGKLLNDQGLMQGHDVTLSGDINNNGTITAAEQLSIEGAALANSGVLQGRAVTAHVSGELQNSGQIGGEQVNLTAGSLNNAQGMVLATGEDGEGLSIAADQGIDNQGGVLASAGVLALNGGLNNNNGQVQATGDVSITGPQLSNVAGLIQAGNNLTLSGDSLDSKDGVLAATNALNLTLSGALNNSGGTVQSETGEIAIKADQLDNSNGTIYQQGTGLLDINAGLNNDQGAVVSNGDLQLVSSTLSNSGGQIGANNLVINAGQFDNSGLVQAQQQLAVTVDNLANGSGSLLALGQQDDALTLQVAGQIDSGANGQIASGGGLDINASGLTNGGLISAANNLGLTLNTLASSGRIEASKQLTISGSQLKNSGVIIAGQDINLHSKGLLSNSGGTLFSQDGSLELVSASLENTAGQIASNHNVTLTADNGLSNIGGLIQGTNVTADTNGNINNAQGQIIAQQLHLQGSNLDNRSGEIAATQLNLKADAVNNTGGKLYSDGTGQGDFVLDIHSLSNDKGLVSSAMNNWQLALDALSNGSGQLVHLGGGQFDLTVDGAATSSGMIASNGALNLAANSIDNQGTVLAQNGLVVDTQGQLKNSGTLQGSAVTLTATSLNNQGQVNSATGITANIAGDVTNSGQLYAAAGDLSLSGKAVTNTGTLSANAVTLNATSLANNGHIQAGQRIDITAASLSNQGAGVISAQQLTARGLTGVTSNQGVIQANTLSMQGGSLDNSGTLAALGSDANALDLQFASVTNQATGTLYSNGQNLTLHGALNNQGQLVHNGSGNLVLGGAGSVTNTGAIQTAGQATLYNGITGAGSVYAQQGMNLAGSSFTNQGGYLATGGALQANTALNNLGGTLLAAAGLNINTSGTVTNSGAIQGKGLTITAGGLNNQNGKLIASGSGATIHAGALDNRNGAIQAASGLLDVQTGTLNNDGGQVYGAGNLQLAVTGGTLSNQGGAVVSGGQADITVSGGLNNTSGTVSAKHLDLTTGALNNSSGKLLAISNDGAGSSTISAASISNNGGTIASDNANLAIKTPGAFVNGSGQLVHVGTGTLDLDAQSLSVASGGQINTNGLLDADIGTTVNNAGTISSANSGDISAAAITNSGVMGSRAGVLTLNTPGALVNQGQLSGKAGLSLTADSLNNTGTAQSDASIVATLNKLTRIGSITGGNVGLNTKGDVTVGSADNLSATGTLSVSTTGNVTNNGVIATGGALLLSGKNLVNNNKLKGGSGTSAFDFTGTVNNASGAQMSGSGNLLVSGSAITNNGTIAAGNTLQLEGGSLTNNDLLYAGSQLNAFAGTITNQNDATFYSAGNMVLAGDSSGGKAGAINNIDSTIAAGANLSLAANTILNKRTGVTYTQGNTTTAYDNYSDKTAEDGSVIHTRDLRTTTTYTATGTGPDARIVSGKDLTLVGGNINNQFGTITAGNNLTLSGSNLNNQAAMNKQETEIQQEQIKYVRHREDTHCESSGVGCNTFEEETVYVGDIGSPTYETNYTGGAFGTISAGGTITGNLSGTFDNAGDVGAIPDAVNTTSSGSKGSASRGNNAASVSGATASVDQQQINGSGSANYSRQSDQHLSGTVQGPVAGSITEQQGVSGQLTAVQSTQLAVTVAPGSDSQPGKDDLAHTELPGDKAQASFIVAGGSQLIAEAVFVADKHVDKGDTTIVLPDEHGSTFGLLAPQKSVAYALGGGATSDDADLQLTAIATEHYEKGGVAHAYAVGAEGSNDAAPGSVAGITHGNLALNTGVAQPTTGYDTETRPEYLSKEGFYNTQPFLDDLGVDPDKTVKQEDLRHQSQVQQAANDANYVPNQENIFLSDEQVKILTEDMGLDKSAIDQSQDALYASLDNMALLDNGDLIAAGGDIAISADQGITNNAGIKAGGQLALATNGNLTNSSLGSLNGVDSLYLNVGGDLDNSGNLTAGNNLSALVGNNINNNGNILAGAGLSLTAGQSIFNNQSLIQGADVSLTATNGDIVNRTEYQQHTVGDDQHNKTYTDVGPASQIVSSNSLSLNAGNNLDLQGSTLSAAGNINLHAGNDVLLNAIEKVSGHEDHFKGGFDIEKDVTYDVVDINAGGNLTVSAGNNLESQGAQFTAGGDAVLAAGNEMDLDAVLESHYDATKKTSKSTFSKKVKETQSLHETVEGTGINAGGDILLNAGKDSDGNLGLYDGGDVTLVGANLNAGGNIVANGNNVDITAGTYQDYDYSHTSKSSFGGLKSKSKEDLEQTYLLSGSNINAGGSVVVNAAEDLDVLASDIKGAGSVELDAANDLVISSGEETSNSKHVSKSGGLFSGGQIYSSTEIADGKTKITANSSTVNAGENLVINAGSATVIGSDLNAGASLAATTTSGDINFLSATESEQSYHNEKEISVGFGDLAKTLTHTSEMLKDMKDEAEEDHRLAFSIAKASYHQADTETNSTTHKASNVSAGNNVSLDSAANMLVSGSNVTADADGDHNGDLNLNAAGNILVSDVTDTYNQSSSSTDGEAALNFTVSNAYVDAADAALAVVAAKDQLKGAKKDYDKFKAQQDQLKSQLASLQQQLANGEPGVTQDDIDDVQAQISMLAGDESWYLTNIALASENLASKSTLLVQQTATAIDSSGTYGFNLGMELNVDATTNESTLAQTTSVGSTLAGQNVNIHTASDGQLALTGSGILASGDMNLDVGSLSMQAGQSTSDSTSSSKHGNVTISQTVYGAAAGGPTINASYDQNSAQDHSVSYTNALLDADNINVVVAGDADLEGANIQAGSSLNATIGGNLTLASLQNTSSGNNHGMGISGGVSFAGVEKPSSDPDIKQTELGKAGAANGANGGFNVSNGSYSNTDTVLSSITSGGELNLSVGGNTQLTGSLIASVDDAGNDLGLLDFSTGSLTFSNLTDRHLQSGSSLSVNASVSPDDPPAGASKQPKDSTGANLAVNSANLGIHNTSSNEKSKVLATVGQGNVTVGGSTDSVAGLNRDTDNINKEIYKVDRIKGNVDVTVDTRILSKDGWNDIAGNVKTIADKISSIADQLGLTSEDKAAVVSHSGIIADILANGGSPEKMTQSELSELLKQKGMNAERADALAKVLVDNPQIIRNAEDVVKRYAATKDANGNLPPTEVVDTSTTGESVNNPDYEERVVIGQKQELSAAAQVVVGAGHMINSINNSLTPEAKEVIGKTTEAAGYILGGPIQIAIGAILQAGADTEIGQRAIAAYADFNDGLIKQGAASVLGTNTDDVEWESITERDYSSTVDNRTTVTDTLTAMDFGVTTIPAIALHGMGKVVGAIKQKSIYRDEHGNNDAGGNIRNPGDEPGGADAELGVPYKELSSQVKPRNESDLRGGPLETAVKFSGRFPLERGPKNGTLYRADNQGNITSYAVYDSDGMILKRVDVTGAAHKGVDTPHVIEYGRNQLPDGTIRVQSPSTKLAPRKADENEIP